MSSPARRFSARAVVTGLLLAAGTGGVAGRPGQASQASPGSLVRQGAGSQSTALLQAIARPIPLRSGLGRAHETITTAVPQAQRYYDQGLACLHAFAWIDAARSFNAALRVDAGAAMAHLGLSYALGELGLSTEARRAGAEAGRLAKAASPRERLRIEVRERQLAASASPGDAAARGAYRTLLERAGREFPDDAEWLLLIGRSQEDGDHAAGMHGDSRSLAFYERARRAAPDYAPVDHYLAHALENLGKPEAALPHARRFAAQAPDAPHARHMYGHALRQVDRMREAIVEFVAADTLHLSAEKNDGIAVALDWHYRHNLDLLAAAYQYQGQAAKAEAVYRRAFVIAAVGPMGADLDVHKRAWPLFLLGQHRPADALAAAQTLQAQASPLTQALGFILANRALQASGRMDDAAAAGNRALRLMRTLGSPGGTLVPDFEVAQGLYLLRGGDTTRGTAMLRAGVTKMLADRRPDAWFATVFELEAAVAAARELMQPALASELVDRLRRHAPFYPGTHYQLGLLAEQRGDAVAARAALAEAGRRWSDADAGLREPVDARTRLAAIDARPARR